MQLMDLAFPYMCIQTKPEDRFGFLKENVEI